VLQQICIRNATRQAVLADMAGVADRSAARRTGLLKHTNFSRGHGLWIVPCEGVHTVGMKFPIDVLFLDRKRKVLKVRRSMVPWRIALCLRAYSVVELPSGTVEATGTVKGDALVFENL
jgi:uncharacterized membrane protein (UPF0127 family)